MIKRFVIFGLPVLVLVGVAWFTMASWQVSYPQAASMPSPPAETLSVVLQRLETAIESHAPDTVASLRAGLARSEIERIEREYGLTLTDELRELYGWHDGVSADSEYLLFGIYQFLPLEELAKTRQAAANDLARATFLQRFIHWCLCRHRANWIELFPDGAGDGYYVDPTRQPSEGAVFYNFNETGDYRFYPTLASLMTAIGQCYEAGLYESGKVSTSVSHFQQEHEIHSQHGAGPR